MDAESIKNSLARIEVQSRVFNFNRPDLPSPPQPTVGTGFVIAWDRCAASNESGNCVCILTCYHVVSGASDRRVAVQFEADLSRRYEGHVASVCVGFDVAVVRVQLDSDAQQPTQLSLRKSMVRIGEAVLAFGYPLSFEGVKSTNGTVSGYTAAQPHQPVRIQTNADISEGNSGGPLVDTEGRVVGINVSTIKSASGIHFAVFVQHFLLVAQSMASRAVVRVPTLQGISLQPAPYIMDTGLFVYRSTLPDVAKGDEVVRCRLSGHEFTVSKYGYLLGDSRHPMHKMRLAHAASFFPRVSLRTRKRWVELELANTTSCRRQIAPYYEEVPHVVVGGLCIGELTLTHTLMDEFWSTWQRLDLDQKDSNVLIVTAHVLGGPYIDRPPVRKGSIVSTANGEAVKTVADLKRVLKPDGRNVLLFQSGLYHFW